MKGILSIYASDPFVKILDEMKAIHDRKSKDYGTGADPLANIRASEKFGIPAWLGAVLRGNDKMTRIQSFAVKGNLANESLEDSLLDLAVYAIIALQLYRETNEPTAAELRIYERPETESEASVA